MPKRIAVCTGGPYVPGLNSVIAGVTRAAHELGWGVVGIRDGYEGLLFPDRYPDRGLVTLTPDLVDVMATGPLLGGSRLDPTRVQQLTEDGQADEVDRSADVMATLARQDIDAVVALVGPRALSLAFKLDRRGLKSIAVPKSIENDLAATERTFGFHTALSFCTDLLDRIRTGARVDRQLAVVEVPGDCAGWLALQSGMAAGADAVLIPEIPFDLDKLATTLASKARNGHPPALVVAAEGARPGAGRPLTQEQSDRRERLRRALSPGSSSDDTDDGRHVIDKAGLVGKAVALALRRRTGRHTYAITAEHMLRGGAPSATDRQLGLAYGAAAVRGLKAGKTGTMTAMQEATVSYVPLAEAVNQIRRVRPDSQYLQAARDLGISLGD